MLKYTSMKILYLCLPSAKKKKKAYKRIFKIYFKAYFQYPTLLNTKDSFNKSEYMVLIWYNMVPYSQLILTFHTYLH